MSADHLSSAVGGIQQHFREPTVKKKTVGKLSLLDAESAHHPLASVASMLLSRSVAMVTGTGSLVQV